MQILETLTICSGTTHFNIKVRRHEAVEKLFKHNMLELFHLFDGIKVNVVV